jgi:hypothetical protein
MNRAQMQRKSSFARLDLPKLSFGRRGAKGKARE